MENPLLEVQTELRRRKNRTVRRLFYSEDTMQLTIIPVGHNDNMIRNSFNIKLDGHSDAVRTADWIERQFADPETVRQNRNLL